MVREGRPPAPGRNQPISSRHFHRDISRGGGFSITVQILPPEIPGTSEAGIYPGAMATRNSNNYLDEVFAYYRIRGEGQISVLLAPDTVHPSGLLYFDCLPTGSGVDCSQSQIQDQDAGVIALVNNLAVGQSLTLKLEADAVENSGGHLHDDNRPAGVFLDPKTGSVIGNPVFKTLQGEQEPTQCHGLVTTGNCFALAYKPSPFGGQEKIVVSSPDATTANTPTLNATVLGTLPQFQQLNGEFTNLEKLNFVEAQVLAPYASYFTIVGDAATVEATYPSGTCTVPNGHPGVGHEAPLGILILLGQVAQQFYGSSGGIRLEINDLSLPDGGLFDICTNWQSPYIYHRMGMSVLISNDLTPQQILMLDQLMAYYHFMRPFSGILDYELTSIAISPAGLP